MYCKIVPKKLITYLDAFLVYKHVLEWLQTVKNDVWDSEDRLQFQLFDGGAHNIENNGMCSSKIIISLTILFCVFKRNHNMSKASFNSIFSFYCITIILHFLIPIKHTTYIFLLGYNMRTVTCIITLKLSDKSSSACFNDCFSVQPKLESKCLTLNS